MTLLNKIDEFLQQVGITRLSSGVDKEQSFKKLNYVMRISNRDRKKSDTPSIKAKYALHLIEKRIGKGWK